jgi:excisionase family DNA binding protein
VKYRVFDEVVMERATYTAREAREIIGMGETAFYQACDQGQIPGARKIGGKWVISRAMLDEWLAPRQQTVDPSAARKALLVQTIAQATAELESLEGI